MTRISTAPIDIIPLSIERDSRPTRIISARPTESETDTNATIADIGVAEMRATTGAMPRSSMMKESDRADRDRVLQTLLKAKLRANTIARRVRQTINAPFGENGNGGESTTAGEDQRNSSTELEDAERLPDALASALTALLSVPQSKIDGAVNVN